MENNRFERLRPYRDNLPQEWFAYTADYFYIYSNQSFTDYTVLLKVEITDSNKSAIDNFTKEIENETDRSSRAFDSWLEHFRRGKGCYSWNSIGSATYESIERVDGVDGRKIQQGPGKSTRQYDSGYTQKSSGNNKTNSQKIVSDHTSPEEARSSGKVSDAHFSIEFADDIAENQRAFVERGNTAISSSELEAQNRDNNALMRSLETTPGKEKAATSMNDENMLVAERMALPFDQAIDLFESGTLDTSQNTHLRVLEHTPQIYIDKAEASDCEIVMSWDVAYLAMNKKGDIAGNYHGLGAEVMKALPTALQDPLYIVKQKNGRIAAVTKIVVKGKRAVFASIELEAYQTTIQEGEPESKSYNLVVTITDAQQIICKILYLAEISCITKTTKTPHTLYFG